MLKLLRYLRDNFPNQWDNALKNRFIRSIIFKIWDKLQERRNCMKKFDLYDFYLEYCIAENEIPLNFEEWEREIYPKDKLFLERIKENELS